MAKRKTLRQMAASPAKGRKTLKEMATSAAKKDGKPKGKAKKTVADEFYGNAGSFAGEFADAMIRSDSKTTVQHLVNELELAMDAANTLVEELGEDTLLTADYDKAFRGG